MTLASLQVYVATILLVDGDPLQALLRKSILERRFPNVLRFKSAAEALCLVEQPQIAAHLALLICSSPMAGIGAPAFVAELRARLPWLPILVLGNEGDSPDDYAAEQVLFLPKSVATQGMLAAACQMMEQLESRTA